MYDTSVSQGDPKLSELSWHLMGDNNNPTSVDKSFIVADDIDVYIIVTTGSYESFGNVAVCMTYTGGDDDIPNSMQQTHLYGTDMQMNTPITSAIDYTGDVDIFKINNAVEGKYSIFAQNNSVALRRILRTDLYYSEYDDYLFELDNQGNDTSDIEPEFSMRNRCV